MSPVSNDGQNTGVRRSSRARRTPSHLDEYEIATFETRSKSATKSATKPATKQSRPKRKAAQDATENITPDDTSGLLEDILNPMLPDERKEYSGWVELESEPGFFGAMLRELGAKDFTIQEIYSIDADTWKSLPQPVHGLIFLFEYEGDDEPSHDENRPDCPSELWFANQTTANACATVALMNIVMNAPGADLGVQLQKFKDSTKESPPPHRGHFLDTNDFIRSIHNSLARRIDLISEDLALDNKYEESLTKKKTQKVSTRGGVSRKKASADANYHYIAYVPVNGQVWELDGFQAKPLRLGPVPRAEGCWWLDVAGEAIQARVLRNSEYCSYNLLAICQSPLKKRTGDLAESLACSAALHDLFASSPSQSIPDPFATFTDARLARLSLTRENVAECRVPASFAAKLERPDFDSAAALQMARDLEAEQSLLEVLMVAELEGVDEMMERFRGRQRRDYTPAIHHWVKALAEKGILRELIQEIDRES